MLDPACGSGSFLIGAYQCLLDWYLKQYSKDPKKYTKGRNPRIVETVATRAPGEAKPDIAYRLTTSERKRILLDHIFGVDIDVQAVEVTKLSLLLKVLEFEGKSGQVDYIQEQIKRGERVLPDLADNIKCGNSLIGPDFYDNTQLELTEEDHYRINVFDWEKEFPEVFKGKNPGFDAVIGNPPYVVLDKQLGSGIIDYLAKFHSAAYKTDLFHLFIERGISLLREDGKFGYIVPNQWLTMKFSVKLREFILTKAKVSEIVVFDHRVFADANVYTCLFFLSSGKPSPNHEVSVRRPLTASSVKEIDNSDSVLVKQSDWLSNDQLRIETRLVGAVGHLVDRIQRTSVDLGKVARASLGCQAYNSSKHSKEQIKNRVFHAESKLDDSYLPELAGSDVARYRIERKKGKWIKYGPWLHDYRSMDWLEGPRILIREIPANEPHAIQACYVEESYCNYKTILNVNPSDETMVSMKYLTGLLNSRLLSFLYPYISNKMVAATFPRLSVGDLRKLPIRTIDFDDPADKSRHDRMVELVERMLALHERLAGVKTQHDRTALERQIAATDGQIDRLVYDLYGLTDEEIRIVEDATAK